VSADVDNRRTGRTTAQLRTALEAARAGERVLYIVHTSAMVGHAFRLPVVDEFTDAKRVSHSRVEFAGGGYVEIRQGAPDYRSIRGRGAALVFDHAFRP
jgi:hypothetical protein